MGIRERNAGAQFEAAVIASALHLWPKWEWPKLHDQRVTKGGQVWRAGQRPCDLCIPLPGGMSLWLECKHSAKATWRPFAERGGVLPHQLRALTVAEGLGHAAYVLLNLQPLEPVNGRFLHECWAIPPDALMPETMNTGSVNRAWLARWARPVPELIIGKRTGWDLRVLAPAEVT